MGTLKFSDLYLLSQRERRGLKVPFHGNPLVIRAGNGFGKSAIVKSLYETFGAQPHKIDQRWRSAQVVSVVEFSVDDRAYSIMKASNTFTVFDAKKRVLLATAHVTKELAPFFADLLNFRLVMTDNKEQTIVPPPDYIFSPFYIDQDEGWSKPWSSFSKMFLPRSRQVLAEYHSGMKSNSYYQALSERDRLLVEMRSIENERQGLSQASKQFRDMAGEVVLNYDLKDFEDDTARLVAESQILHEKQARYLKLLASLNEERQLWVEQKELVKTALAEMDEAFSSSLDEPSVVECPTCGQHYENSIVERFALIEDQDGFLAAFVTATEKIRQLDEKIGAERDLLKDIETSLRRIDGILSAQNLTLSFRDVVAAEGRNEASRLIKERLSAVNGRASELNESIDHQKNMMKLAVDEQRSREIRDFFDGRLAAYCQVLDVVFDGSSRQHLSSISLARGSEGPRGIIAYFYAFLQTAKKYGSSPFCPIVIDAPNQQGQDAVHMPQIMDFIIRYQPEDSQLIIATESLFGLADDDIDIVVVGKEKRQVLMEEQYQEVSDLIRPYLGQLL